jgi:Apea-like HEPN
VEFERELEDLHRRRRLAIVVRAEQADAPLHSTVDGRSLSWPLAVLNLALERPVRAVAAYRMIRGGAILPTRTAADAFGRCFVPAEIARWDPRPDRIAPRTLPPLDNDQCRTIAGLARTLDTAVNHAGLKDWQLAQFWHAIDRLITVSYHTHDRQLPDKEYEPLPFMNPVEATVQLVAALEGLFDDEGTHGDVTRRLAQRVTVLVTTDDTERTAIRDKINRHYRVRSNRAHGSPRPPKDVDLPDLRDLARRAILGWATLAPTFAAKGALAAALDNALMSPGTTGCHVAELLTRFRSARASTASSWRPARRWSPRW